MYKKMLTENFREITTICQRIMEQFLITNSDILTRGRQTWDSIKERSVPSPSAYQEMANLFQMNLGKEASNCLEWIQMYFECMELSSIKTKKKREITKTKTIYDKKHNQRVKKTKTLNVFSDHKVEGIQNCREHMFNLSRDFCSYIKHGERAKLNRRAIASPNMIKRMFFKIIEQFHLDMSKLLPGSTISIGGEEKKSKIISNLAAATIVSGEKMKLQATQAATKWNECLSPECFAMMHMTFFSDYVRRELKLPNTSDMERLFLKICLSSHWILANKRITLGEGPVAFSETSQNRLKWTQECIPRMNQRTAEWFKDAFQYLQEGTKLLEQMLPL